MLPRHTWAPSAPVDNEIPLQTPGHGLENWDGGAYWRGRDGFSYSHAGPGGRERSVPIFSVGKLRLRKGAAPSGIPPGARAAVCGRKAGPGLEDRTADRRQQGRAHSPWRAERSLPGSGRSLCSRTRAGPSPGGGGEGTQAVAAAELAPLRLNPAPPRACYINQRGTMSPNFVVGI